MAGKSSTTDGQWPGNEAKQAPPDWNGPASLARLKSTILRGFPCIRATDSTWRPVLTGIGNHAGNEVPHVCESIPAQSKLA
jgi:hypothetical protein